MAAATQPGFSQVLHSGPARFAKALTKSDSEFVATYITNKKGWF